MVTGTPGFKVPKTEEEKKKVSVEGRTGREVDERSEERTRRCCRRRGERRDEEKNGGTGTTKDEFR